jgi:hypothetical protein
VNEMRGAKINHQTIATAVRRRAAIEGRRDVARQEREVTLADVGQAKARMELQDSVRSVLERLQKAEHERAVGSFERLLTALLQDVLPEPLEVAMDLYTEKGLPALDVYVRKGPGAPLEDAYSGMGGAVTNLLSAGLRIISLMRSGRRRLLVLDEADCWVRPLHIPAFAKVINEISQQFGMQVLMISHHEEAMFEGILPHRLRMEKSDGGISAQWSPTSDIPVWESDQPGIRMIELIGFQSHTNTLLPLSPGITFLQGENNLGKSSVNTALRAVAYGESPETLINHEADHAEVRLHLEKNRVLEWKRFRKGRVKVSYRLTEHGNNEALRTSDSARGAPDWLLEETGLGMVDDLDIQLCHQKKPVFLLNEPASKRAKALAVGLEGSHVQTMMTLDRGDIQEARGVVRAGERSLEQLARILEVTEQLKGDPGLSEMAMNIESADRQQEAAGGLQLTWKLNTAKKDVMVAIDGNEPTRPEAPRAPLLRTMVGRWIGAKNRRENYQGLGAAGPLPCAGPNPTARLVLTQWRRATKKWLPLQRMGGGPVAPEAPKTPTELVRRWQVLTARRLTISLPAPPSSPGATRAGIIRQTLSRWALAANELKTVTSDQLEVGEMLLSTDQKLTKHLCQTCGQALPGHLH